jgi:hypothetical protein
MAFQAMNHGLETRATSRSGEGMKANMRTFLAAGAVIVTAILAMGCSSSPNGGNGDENEFRLLVIMEKNMELEQDILVVEFTQNNARVPDGQVIVHGDALSAFASNGTIAKTYPIGQWATGVWIHIVAFDSTGSAVHRDSVIIPEEFTITNLDPAIGTWFPRDNTAIIEWSAAINASNYAVSVKGRGSAAGAEGYHEYHATQTGLSETFDATVFSDDFNILPGDYHIQVIAYNPNFLVREGVPYLVPELADVPAPIVSDNVSGAIAALVVTDKVTLEVVVE